MNIKLFKEALDYIKANPEKWNQDMNIFDTGTGCFLFHVMRISGMNKTEYVRDKRSGSQIGADLLNISHDEGNYLWGSNRTIQDFEQFLADHEPEKVSVNKADLIQFESDLVYKAYLEGFRVAKIAGFMNSFPYLSPEILAKSYSDSLK